MRQAKEAMANVTDESEKDRMMKEAEDKIKKMQARSTLHPQPSTLNPQPSTLNPQPSTLSLQH